MRASLAWPQRSLHWVSPRGFSRHHAVLSVLDTGGTKPREHSALVLHRCKGGPSEGSMDR